MARFVRKRVDHGRRRVETAVKLAGDASHQFDDLLVGFEESGSWISSLRPSTHQVHVRSMPTTPISCGQSRCWGSW